MEEYIYILSTIKTKAEFTKQSKLVNFNQLKVNIYVNKKK